MSFSRVQIIHRTRRYLARDNIKGISTTIISSLKQLSPKWRRYTQKRPEYKWKNRSTWGATHAKLSDPQLSGLLSPGPSIVFTNLCFQTSCFTSVSILQILITLKLTCLVLFFSFNVLLILSNSRHPQIRIIIFSTSFHWLLFLLVTFDNRISRSSYQKLFFQITKSYQFSVVCF